MTTRKTKTTSTKKAVPAKRAVAKRAVAKRAAPKPPAVRAHAVKVPAVKAPARASAAIAAKAPASKPARAAKAPPSAGKRGRSLVIVESPAKARTIAKYLGPGFEVRASNGHVRDLPKSKLGVDIEHGFEPSYILIKGKAKILKDLKQSAKQASTIYLAPDPDREGEAIAWHLAETLGDDSDGRSASRQQRC